MTTLGPYQVAATDDDWNIYYYSGWNWATSDNDSGSYVIPIGYYNSHNFWAGFRFALGAAIPSGVTISSAVLSVFSLGGSDWSAGTDNIRVFASLSADAAQSNNAGQRPSVEGGSITLTSASVLWPNSGGLTPASSDWMDSSNLASIIQELVDAYGGLASGAHIVIWCRSGQQPPSSDPSAVLTLASEEDAAYGAKLTIDYTTGSGFQAAWAANSNIIIQPGVSQ